MTEHKSPRSEARDGVGTEKRQEIDKSRQMHKIRSNIKNKLKIHRIAYMTHKIHKRKTRYITNFNHNQVNNQFKKTN